MELAKWPGSTMSGGEQFCWTAGLELVRDLCLALWHRRPDCGAGSEARLYSALWIAWKILDPNVQLVRVFF